MAEIISCTRKLHFCAGHRVMGHENKCAHLHGHNYIVFLEAVSTREDSSTDSLGRVADFSVLKEAFDPWIQTNWDHGFILHERDDAAQAAMGAFQKAMSSPPHSPNTTPFFQKIFLLPYNPTAENLASYLFYVVAPQVLPAKYQIDLRSVRIWETPNCFATMVSDPEL